MQINRKKIYYSILASIVILFSAMFFLKNLSNELQNKKSTSTVFILNQKDLDNLIKSKIIAQKSFFWPNGKKLAVSLTYDDGLEEHINLVAPLLSQVGLKGTFYVPIYKSLLPKKEEWKKIAEMGHELGNHSIFHPCRRDHLTTYNIDKYDLNRWYDEMNLANSILESIDHNSIHSFAIPCAQTIIGPLDCLYSIEPLIKELFECGRSYNDNEIIVPQNLSFTSLPSISCDRLYAPTFKQILQIINKAEKVNGWAILTFHGVGNNKRDLTIAKDDHLKLINYLSENQDKIWVAPVIDVSQYLKSSGWGYHVQ